MHTICAAIIPYTLPGHPGRIQETVSSSLPDFGQETPSHVRDRVLLPTPHVTEQGV